jgi:hypothetical protein
MGKIGQSEPAPPTEASPNQRPKNAQRAVDRGVQLRDRRAVARYAGLTGTPDESGSRRRDKGLSKAGNRRVRRGMVQLAPARPPDLAAFGDGSAGLLTADGVG